MDEQQASFGERLRQFRVRAGLSQAALAERANLSPAAVMTLERGVRSLPYRRTVEALAEALGLAPAERAALAAAAQHARRLRPSPAPGPAPPVSRAPQLPNWLTSFVGREDELASIRALLDPARSATRLLTLVGPGGVGKTRLAAAAAANLVDAYPDGAVFVDLVPLRDPRLVSSTIARAVGLREAGGRSARDLLLEHLRQRRLLLVLDNFEHLLGAAPLLADLLQACAQVALLVTSRAALRLRGEQRFAVPPLAAPTVTDDTNPAVIHASPAVQLFIARAQAVAADFTLPDHTLATVAAICRRLDGIPLAIELAAAWVPLLAPDALLSRLERRLSLLTSGAADLPERQQTLRSTLAWSYDLLAANEQAVFRRLAVFAGGWTLAATEAVCADAALSADQVLDCLQRLVDSSLVRRVDETGEEARFGMLETVREFTYEQLVSCGELERIRAAHAAFYAQLAEPAAAARTSAPWTEGQSPALTDEALDRLEAELDNLQVALNWWATADRPAEGLRLGVALSPLWSRRGHYAVGRRWLEALLELADQTAPAAATARPLAEQALALMQVGSLATLQGDNEQARTFYRRSVGVWRALDHAPGLAIALANLGLAEWVAGAAAPATALLEEALARSRAANLPHTVVISLRNLGLIARAQGQYARAEALFGEAAAQELPPGWFRGYSLARSLSCLGRVVCLRHDLPRAGSLLGQAFAVIRQAHTRGQALADCLDWQAALEAQQGNLDRAVRLFGAADSHWRASGAHRYLPDEAAYARDLVIVRAAMEEQAFATGWAEGAAMPADQAIAYALKELDSASGGATGSSHR